MRKHFLLLFLMALLPLAGPRHLQLVPHTAVSIKVSLAQMVRPRVSAPLHGNMPLRQMVMLLLPMQHGTQKQT